MQEGVSAQPVWARQTRRPHGRIYICLHCGTRPDLRGEAYTAATTYSPPPQIQGEYLRLDSGGLQNRPITPYG